MRIVTISDLHGQHDRIIQPDGGDMIICAGDISPRGTRNDVEEFLRWYADLQFEKKILIAGNHDWDFEKSDNGYYVERCEDYGITYLNDSGITYKGLKIWGSPVQPEFNRWAFNRARSIEDAQRLQIPDTKPHWDKIPENTDILVTHGPPMGILDLVKHPWSSNKDQNVGCEKLMQAVKKIKPKLHIFGHIHEGRGVKVVKMDKVPVTFVNTSCLNEMYRPYEQHQYSFDWDKVILGKSRGKDF